MLTLRPSTAAPSNMASPHSGSLREIQIELGGNRKVVVTESQQSLFSTLLITLLGTAFQGLLD